MEIYVEPKRLGDAAEVCDRLRNRLENIENRFNTVYRSIDWNIKAQPSINQYVSLINKSFDKGEDTLRRHYTFLSDARDAYTETERSVSDNAASTENELFGGNGGSGAASSAETSFRDFIRKLAEQIKRLFEQYVVGMLNRVFSFLKNSIFKFAGLGIELIQGILNCKDCYSMVNKLMAVYKGAKETVIFGGVISAVSAVVPVALDFAGQFFTSIDKYIENGITGEEWGRIGIESSTKGLFSVAEGLLMVGGVGAMATGVGFVPGALMVAGGFVLQAADSAFGMSDGLAGMIEKGAESLSGFIRGKNAASVSNPTVLNTAPRSTHSGGFTTSYRSRSVFVS